MVYYRPYITEEHTCTPKNTKLNTINDVLVHLLFIVLYCIVLYICLFQTRGPYKKKQVKL